MVPAPIEVPPKSGSPLPLHAPLPGIVRQQRVAASLAASFSYHVTSTQVDSQPRQASSLASGSALCSYLSERGVENWPCETNESAQIRVQNQSQHSEAVLRHTAHGRPDFVCLSDLDLLSDECRLNVPGEESDEDQVLFGCRQRQSQPLWQESKHCSVLIDSNGGHENTKRASREHIDILKTWLSEHNLSPYPNHRQKDELLVATGLSYRQLNVCLSNLRARTGLGSRNGIRPSSDASVDHVIGVHVSAMSELIDADPCGLPNTWDTSSFGESLDLFGPNPCDLGTGSMDLCASATNATESSLSSPFSSAGFVDSIVAERVDFDPLQAFNQSGSRRKGKRRHARRIQHNHKSAALSIPLVTTCHDTQSGADKYHCTACSRSFKDPYAWKRPESGVHGHSDTQWVCTLQESILIDGKCIFCSDIVSDVSHFELHNLYTCYGADKAERTFTRKDGLKQHVVQKHLVSANDYVRKGFEPPKCWSEQAEMSMDARWCGFCLKHLEDTSTRMKHVAQHFKDGADMGMWVPLTTI